MDVRDVLVRAAKTAVEVFIAAMPAGLIFTDAASAVVLAKSAGLAAASAAVSVVLNAVLSWAQSSD